MLKKKKTIEYIHIDLWNILRKFFLGKKSNEFYIYIYIYKSGMNQIFSKLVY